VPEKPKMFLVEVSGSLAFTVEDLWPDGDAPTNPTAEDAAKALREIGNRPSKVCLELGIPLTVTVDGKQVTSDPW
jgi:hypothetical protein